METREIYWNIQGHMWLYVFAAAAMAVFAYGVWARLRLIRRGASTADRGRIGVRLWAVVSGGLLHRRFWSDFSAGALHLMIMWGFLVLAFGTFIVLVRADLGLDVFRGPFYLWLSLAMDLFGLAVLTGVLTAAIRRYVVRTTRLQNRLEDAAILGGLALIIAQGFVLEALRIAATDDPWSAWTPVGSAIGRLFAGLSPEAMGDVHQVVWWTHLFTALAWIAYIPYSKLIHVILAPTNLFVRGDIVRGGLPPIDFEDETRETYGLATAEDLDWGERLSVQACTRCGRCEEVCPAHISGKSLTPRQVVLDLRALLEEGLPWSKSTPDATEPGVVASRVAHEAIWSCTTCGACAQACPALIEHAPLLVQMRQYLVMIEGALPSEAQTALRNVEVNYNPWGVGWADRAVWAEGHPLSPGGADGAAGAVASRSSGASDGEVDDG